MATASFTTPGTPLTMAALKTFLDAAFGELLNRHRGASAPDSPVEGQLWWDTSGDPVDVLKRYTVAAGWVSILTMNVTAGTITAIHGIKDEDTMASDSAVLPPSQQSVKAYVDNAGLVSNLKPVVNATVNKLDIFTKSGGAAPDSTNIIRVAIPDGAGHTLRSRAAAYLSGTGQIILADAGNYWSKGSLDGEIKTAWLYAIWDGTGIVWALAGYSGFTQVPTTTTVTDDDYFLLEASSTYTRSNAHYCVAVAKIRYQYDTADTPDHTIQATVIDAPQVIWNPKSDYSIYYPLTANVTSGSDIADAAILARAVKQSGKYLISASVLAFSDAAATLLGFAGTLKVGGSTYAGGTTIRKIYAACDNSVAWNPIVQPSVTVSQYLNTNDIVWLGGTLYAGAGNRVIDAGGTHLTISRED